MRPSFRTTIALSVLLAALTVAHQARGQGSPRLDTEQPVVGNSGEASSRSDTPAVVRHAIWTQPVLPVFGLLANWYNLNVGYSHSLSRGMDLVLEGGIGYLDRSSSSGSGVVTAGASAGLALLLTGSRPLNGLYVLPKLQFGHIPLASISSTSGSSAFTIGLGLDLGYQLTFGNFYLSPLLGLGYNFLVLTSGTADRVAFAPGFNLALVRIGYAWGASDTSNENRHRPGLDWARDRRPRHVAVWILPAWLAIGPLLGRYNFGGGINVPLTDRVSAVIELGTEWGSENNVNMSFGRTNYTSFQSALGIAFALTGTNGLNGLFLQPKLQVATFYPANSTGGLSPALTFSAGADIGYHITVGPVYFAPVIGIGVECTALASPDANPTQRNGVRSFPNFTLLRMGIAL